MDPNLNSIKSNLPGFIPPKELLWGWLKFVATEDHQLGFVHAGISEPAVIKETVQRWRPHIMNLSQWEWDDRFIESILIEFCDPNRIAYPDADRYADLMKQWDDGLFDPEPV